MKKTNFANITAQLFLLILTCSCSFKMKPLSTELLRGVEDVQPVRVSLSLGSGEFIQFEVYLEKKTEAEYQIFGIHPVMGKIFLVEVRKTETKMLENISALSDREIAQVLKIIESRRIHLKSGGCFQRESFTEGGSIQLMFSGSCDLQ